MSEILITCPNCSSQFAIDELLKQQIEMSLREQVDADSKVRAAALEDRENTIARKELDLQSRLDSVEISIAEKVKQKEVLLRQHVEKEFNERFERRLEELSAELTRKEGLLKTTQANELLLRTREREVQERAEAIDLEIARRLSEAVATSEASIRRKVEEERSLKEAEKDHQIETLKVQLEAMRQKLDQGSQQLQGEAFEESLEVVLASSFPSDEVAPVPSGIRGADITQRVRDTYGRVCGTIVWELKQTKSWSENWVAKLKEDLAAVRGDIGVIASRALPSDVSVFQLRDGVWVTEPRAVVALATALRTALIQVGYARAAAEGMAKKSDAVYAYLTSQEFRQRMESIVDAFKAMQKDLEAEKRAYNNIWAKREKQISRAIGGAVGLYGSLQGIIGAGLETLPDLGLDWAEGTADGKSISSVDPADSEVDRD